MINRGVFHRKLSKFIIGYHILVIMKLGLDHMDASSWHLEGSLKDWWDKRTSANMPNRKALASLTMLVTWTIWNERNSRFSRHKSAPPTILLNTILEEAKLWSMVEAKQLGAIIVRE